MSGNLDFLVNYSENETSVFTRLWGVFIYWWRATSGKGLEIPNRLTWVNVTAILALLGVRLLMSHAIRTTASVALEIAAKISLVVIPFDEYLQKHPFYSKTVDVIFIIVACLTVYAINRKSAITFLSDIRKYRTEVGMLLGSTIVAMILVFYAK